MQRLNHNDLDLDLNDESVERNGTEKCDISEEITALKAILTTNTNHSEGSIGRQIEFLLQEVSRELNTICSKLLPIAQKALEEKPKWKNYENRQ